MSNNNGQTMEAWLTEKVKASKATTASFPLTDAEPQTLPIPSPSKVVISDIRLSWNCVARLSLQFVLMSSLVAAFIVGIVWIVAGVLHGLAEAMQTMPPRP